MDMADKLKAARALGYLEGLGLWLWEHMADSDDSYCEGYDKALEVLRKAIDWSE